MQGTKLYMQNNLNYIKNIYRKNWQEIQQNATVVVFGYWDTEWDFLPPSLLSLVFQISFRAPVLLFSETNKLCLNIDIYGYKYKSFKF